MARWYEHKLPPPVIDAACAGLMWWLAGALPALQLWPRGAWPFGLGAALGLALAGGVIALAGLVEFRRARTTFNPLDPDRPGQVVKDASFVLARHPDRPILMTSSTIDGYGRAALLDPGETVQERELLAQVLRDGAPPGEVFDTDLMFWHNGWATLFAAVHVCLGNVREDGAARVLARHRKDPLTVALRRFDRRLPVFYAEVRDDLDTRIAQATGPHHLFHVLTEDPAVRLHLTRRLIESA